MAKKRYKFNTETLTYEEVVTPFRLRFYRLLRELLVGFILASLINFAFSYFFYTPKMSRIVAENKDIEIKYTILNDKINAASKKIGEIKHRDNNVYRMLFAADTLSIQGIYAPYSPDKYRDVEGDLYSDLMVSTWMDLDALTKLIYLESVSMDELQVLSQDKEKMSLAIPAIWPIDRRTLRGQIGAFGGRNHPILGSYRMHTGIDLAANKGTPIYATGNGIVQKDPNAGSGYGLQVLINHGFGYKTRYAHMSKIHVVPGQPVKRGELIGEVGSTGRSTSPHLHYEVIYMGKHVNPINYFRKDMEESEFERIIEMATETTYETLAE